MSVDAVYGMIPEWTVADRIRKARESAGMDQTQLAEAAGISRRSVTSYETGHTPPRRPQLLAIGMATGVPWQWLESGKVLTQGGGPDGGLQPSGWSFPLALVA